MAATKIAKKVNKYFVLYASEHIQEIDMDKRGLYCMILSENDENMMYRVDVDESDLVPVATGCSCTGRSSYRALADCGNVLRVTVSRVAPLREAGGRGRNRSGVVHRRSHETDERN